MPPTKAKLLALPFLAGHEDSLSSSIEVQLPPPQFTIAIKAILYLERRHRSKTKPKAFFACC